jgi:ABC-type multidrug transport system fused ATPase/permease subunit
VLFSGNLRSNLDPFDEFDDESIYVALRRVELIPTDDDVDVPEQRSHSFHTYEELNTNVFTDLETPVSEGGLNFSQGQRQLICLARALLKKNRIVFMDEATASVDFETDEAIQKTIASAFSECTILCIAHRLRTVIEYDKILVLDQGEIVEFANPLTLLETPESVFNKMCENSGEYDNLLALAKEKHQLVDV